MRLRTTALVASAFFGLLYVTMPGASALPAAPRADITATAPAATTQPVHWRRGGWGRRYYRPYGFYGYRPYYYRPYRFYRPYYYGGWGWRHPYRRFY
jgi:hypothetical protein